jgi:ABC-2 type transport system permease protein
MQVCKAFARVAKKHLPNTFIYFIVFVVLLIAMSANASSTSGKQFQVSAVNLCIFDNDNSEASQALTAYLSSLHHIVSLPSETGTPLFTYSKSACT